MLLERRFDTGVETQDVSRLKEKVVSLEAENEILRRELSEQKQAIARLEARMNAFEDATQDGKAYEVTRASPPQNRELSDQAKEFLNCGMVLDAPPKSMRWTAFVSVMEELGFKPHAPSGSGVRFDPPNADSDSINIYKPYPDPTLTPIMLLKIVQRLRVRYGVSLQSHYDAAAADARTANTPSRVVSSNNHVDPPFNSGANARHTWFSKLDKRVAGSTLLRMSPDFPKQPSPMKWDTFVMLMTEMGFTREPTTGSSVRFSPPNPKDHSISIHKPQPDPTLTPIMLIKISKRLKRYYGWDTEDFTRQTLAATHAQKRKNEIALEENEVLGRSSAP